MGDELSSLIAQVIAADKNMPDGGSGPGFEASMKLIEHGLASLRQIADAVSTLAVNA